MVKKHKYHGVVAAGGFYLEFTEGSPEKILAEMQGVIDGKTPNDPIVYRCKQAAGNYRSQ